MSKVKELVYDIEEAITDGVDFISIAKKFNVPLRWVTETAEDMAERELEVRYEYE